MNYVITGLRILKNPNDTSRMQMFRVPATDCGEESKGEWVDVPVFDFSQYRTDVRGKVETSFTETPRTTF